MAKHSNVKDAGAVFVIVPNTRKVVVPTSHFVIGTVGEHLSEQVTFECPATIDGHDITGCDKHYVTWQSADGTVGHDELVDMTVNEGVASFKWNVRNGLTTATGVVSFSVHFEDTASGNTVYKFSTTTCKSCEILDAINAIVGAYEAVYVADDALIFADYNAVKDGTLALDTNGLIPEGSLTITANGSYDVGKYAEVKVDITDAIPTIMVGEDGVVIASTPADYNEHTLSSLDDPDFKGANIRHGVNIFGVDGNCPVVEYVTGQIQNNAGSAIKVHMFGWSALSFHPRYQEYEVSAGKPMGATLAKGSPIVIRCKSNESLFITSGAETISSIVKAEGSMYAVQPTGDGFNIVISDKG